jgi:hypothetical protein
MAGKLGWLREKYGRLKKHESSGHQTSADKGDNFLRGKFLEELSHDEYVVLIDSYYNDLETLGEIGDAIGLNKQLSEDEKGELWDRIDRETKRK